MEVEGESGWRKMSWGAVLGGGATTHGAATLSAPLKAACLIICIGKQAAGDFKVSMPMGREAGVELCLSMCAGVCAEVCEWGFISWECHCQNSRIRSVQRR